MMGADMDIGERIRAARERAGLTQHQLAEACGVSDTAVTLWENRKNRRGITNEHLEKVAEILGVSMGTLLGEKPPKPLTMRTGATAVVVSKTEKALLDLFRTFPQELQLLQLAQFVECAKFRKDDQLTRHEAGDGLSVTIAGGSQAA